MIVAFIALYFFIMLTQSGTQAVLDHTQHDYFEARKTTILETLDQLQPKLVLEEKRKSQIQRQVFSMARGQREDPPDEPLVWLLLVTTRLRNEASKFGSELAQLARGQPSVSIDARTVATAEDFERLIRDHLDNDQSLVIEHLNEMAASNALGLYQFDDTADLRTRNKTIVLHYETDQVDPKEKTDKVVNDVLTVSEIVYSYSINLTL